VYRGKQLFGKAVVADVLLPLLLSDFSA